MYGYLTNPGATFIDSNKTDLNKLSIIELRDILTRQDILLRSGKFINSLPDKGQKIREYRQKVQEKLKSKELVEETTSILAKLNLSQKVDLKHPMGCDSSAVLKPQVDPYAKVLSQALDETLPKAKVKFVPSKSKDEAKKETSGPSTPELSKMNSDQNYKATPTPVNKPQQSNMDAANTMDWKPNIVKPTKSQTGKSEYILEKYKDTGLAYGPREIQLQELSVDESLALSKSQIEKEKQVNLLRRVERTIKIYEQAEQEEIPDESDHEEESEDEKGTSVVFQYMK